MKKATQDMRDVQHFGEEGGVVPVIDVASTSTFLNPWDMEKVFNGELEGCYLYSRHSNPTTTAFGQKLAALEGMEAGIGVASGMAAISCAIGQIMADGGHIISSRNVYGGTYAYFNNVLPKMGISVDFINDNDFDEIERLIRKDTKVFYVETMSNPLLRITDLKRMSEIAKKHDIKLVVDNTFTPFIVSPIKFGADVVIHSCTKFISGNNDLVAGAICGTKDFIGSLIDLNEGQVMLRGPVMDSKVAHELYLRLDSLAVRMKAHSETAAYFANRMEEDGVRVVYPGLKSHPNHDLLLEMRDPEFGFGGMITVDSVTRNKALKLAAELQGAKFGLYAVSLGFSRTLISCPSASTSSEIPEDEQTKGGLTPGLLRMSIGYTGDREIMYERFISCYKKVMN